MPRMRSILTPGANFVAFDSQKYVMAATTAAEAERLANCRGAYGVGAQLFRGGLCRAWQGCTATPETLWVAFFVLLGIFFWRGLQFFFDTFDYCWLFLAPFGPFLSTSDYFWLPSPIFGYLDHLLLLWSILTIFWPFGGFWYIFGHFLTHFDDFWPLCASLWDVGFSKQMRMRWVRLLGEVGADRCQG